LDHARGRRCIAGLNPWLASLLVLGTGIGCTSDSVQPSVPTAESSASPNTAEEILRRVEEVYVSCRTYRDRGMARSSLEDGDGGVTTDEVTFSTVFERGGRFRIEVEGQHFQEPLQYVIASDAATTWARFNQGERRVENSLESALTGANGACNGVPCLITRLLVPEWRLVGTDLRGLEELQRLPDETFRDRRCFVLGGVRKLPRALASLGTASEESTRVWIETESFAVVGVTTEVEFSVPREDGGSTVVRSSSSFEFDPEFDVDIPDAAFEFEGSGDRTGG
jgi:hypothetical protein